MPYLYIRKLPAALPALRLAVINPSRLKGSKLGRPLSGRIRELGLDKDLLHALHTLIVFRVNLVHLLHLDPVGDHVEGLELAGLDLLEQVFPVEMDGGLAVADEADAALHYRADVEVIGLRNSELVEGSLIREGGEETYEADVDTSDTATAVILDTGDHFVQNFTRVCLCANE